MLRKILVVDDSELLHRMYDLVLMRYRNAGTIVLHARNGSEAVNTVHQHDDIDLMLLDINMPVMGGLQVLNGLRVTGRLSRLTVIMVSTEGHEADVQHALVSGASAYVTKPFTPAHLYDLIARRFGNVAPTAARTS
ncbi:MAG TPA: response regulator [Thermoanaerobaculia bacterium]|nr:response regulator [Thermoanaerobaculia bacterium]